MGKIKVIVTGGTGFIGSHLVEALVNEKKYEITVIDLEIEPFSYFARSNMGEKAPVRILDIRNRRKITSFIKKYRPDYIFHLAAEPIVEESYRNPLKAFETNIMGTVNILDACRELKNIKGIIVASSDKAYGKTKKAYRETDALRGDHPYDVSKSCQDLISLTYFTTYQLPVVVTRFGNVYGEGDSHFERLIPGICESVVKKRTLKIRSDGKYVRDYLYVKDVVGGYLFLLTNMKKVLGQAFNFSSNENLTVLEVVARVEKAIGKKITYVIENTAKNEIPYQHLDDSKIKKLGWKNNFSLSQTIGQTMDWYVREMKK